MVSTGDCIKGWNVESLIGEGSFGRVYKVTRTEFGHTYESALKVIRIPQNQAEAASIRYEGMSDEGIRAYFLEIVEDIAAEVALMSDLRGNSNIVSYEDHEVVELTDNFGWEIYIRMELVTPLFEYLKDHSLTEKDVVRMGADICRALELCHTHNIIHRDIKPENIFVSKQGSFKLGDFGIARQVEKTRAEMSRKGTYSYMAPEVYKGGSYNSSADIYSLGIVLYRFLNNNRLPFLPTDSGYISYTDRQNANIERLKGRAPEAPCNTDGRLAEIILKACAYDSKDRYRNAADMLRDLEEIAADENKIVYPAAKIPDEEESVDIEDATIPLFGWADEAYRPDSGMIDEEQRETLETEMSAETEAESSENTVPNSKCKKRLAAIAALILCVAAAVCFCLIRKVPDVRGNTADAAREAIEDAGLEYSESREFSTEVERGMVISQSPSDGIVRRGSDVEVTISRGIPVTVPDLVGKDMDDAKEMPEVSELKLTTTGKEFSDTLSKGLIIRQDPYPGTECEEGSEISVVISKGITQVTVPAVTGKTTEEAIAVLEKEGFKVAVNSQYSGYAAGTIAYQSVEGGDTADIHSEITITESLGAAPAKKSRSKKSGKSKPKSDVFG